MEESLSTARAIHRNLVILCAFILSIVLLVQQEPPYSAQIQELNGIQDIVGAIVNCDRSGEFSGDDLSSIIALPFSGNHKNLATNGKEIFGSDPYKSISYSSNLLLYSLGLPTTNPSDTSKVTLDALDRVLRSEEILKKEKVLFFKAANLINWTSGIKVPNLNEKLISIIFKSSFEKPSSRTTRKDLDIIANQLVQSTANVTITSEFNGNTTQQELSLNMRDVLEIRELSFFERCVYPVAPYMTFYHQDVRYISNPQKPFENKNIFPNLKKIWHEVKYLPIEKATKKLNEKQGNHQKITQVSLGGVTVDSTWLLSFLPYAALGLLIYLMLHLQHINNNRYNYIQSIESYPWVSIYPFLTARLFTFSTLVLLPLAAIIMLTATIVSIDVGGQYVGKTTYLSKSTSLTLVVLFIASLFTALQCFRLSNQIVKTVKESLELESEPEKPPKAEP